VIPIVRLDLDPALLSRLDARRARLVALGVTGANARQVWKSSRTAQRGLRAVLALMAAGIQRCMYCGDNLGTDIDHFDPMRRSPVKTFEWANHLLACSHCNSNVKRDEYPCDKSGLSLLLDPTRDDPREHVRLILNEGKYEALTPKGSETIRVFGLNRPDLVRGRENAFRARRAILLYTDILLSEGRESEAQEQMKVLVEEPHATVFYTMIQTCAAPSASLILGYDVVAVLSSTEIRRLITLVRPKHSSWLAGV
jgi:uncharacterized protein (TIGR02646 family)